MAQSSSVFSQLHPFQLTKIHWRNEVVMHLLFGVPIISIATSFWNLGIEGILRCFALYIAIWVIVYLPFYFILPRLMLYPIYSLLSRLQNQDNLGVEEVRKLVVALLQYAPRTGIIVFFGLIPGYVLGGYFIFHGFIPQILVEQRFIIAVFTVIAGVALSAAESLMSFTVFSQHMRLLVREVLVIYPNVLLEEIPIRRISLNTKLLVFIGGVVFVIETILLNFFIASLSILAPQLLLMGVVYGFAIVIVSFIFILMLIPRFSSNIASPLAQIATWSKMIMDGKTDQRLLLTTNDEVGDVVRYETQMMLQLNANRAQMEKDKVIITTEKSKLSAILAGISDGVIAVDTDFKITVINDPALRLLAADTEGLVGSSIDSVLFLEDSKHSSVAASYFLDKIARNVLTPEQCFPDSRYILRNKSEEMRLVSVSVQKVSSSFDTHVLYILTLHDLTEFLKLEDMKLDFVSMAAHELRTPLTAVQGYLSVAFDETKQLLNSEQKEYMQRSLDAANSLNRLIEDVISVSNLEKGEFSLDYSESDLIALIESIISTFVSRAESKHINLQFVHPNMSSLVIHMDVAKISRLLSSLIENGIAFTPESGNVMITLERHEKEVQIRVQDNGIGISQDAQRYLFTKFYRVKRSLEQGTYGTGLGLYMARKIVEMHGGTISLASEIGKGSVFTVVLPIN